MSRTLRFGYDSAAPRIQSRIDRFVVRKHTSAAYDGMEQAANDYARKVAFEVSPGQKRAPRPVGGIPAVPFGKR